MVFWMVLGSVMLVCLVVLAWLLWRGPSGMLEGYLERFPGRCPICAFHAYGIMEGHVRPGEAPKPHECPEGMSRWNGA